MFVGDARKYGMFTEENVKHWEELALGGDHVYYRQQNKRQDFSRPLEHW